MELNNKFQMPKDGLPGLQKHWRSDLFASLFVFMLSLPYTLGLAFAAQFPISSGIITILIGAFIITFISGSHLTIKAPGISLIPILFFAVHTMGSGYLSTGYKFTFAIIIVAGFLQIIFGLTKLGRWLLIIPDSVMYGVLASVGLIVLIHQAHYLVGLVPEPKNTFILIYEFPLKVIQAQQQVAIIGISSLFLLIIFTSFRVRHAVFFPSPMVVMLLGIAIAYYLDIKSVVGEQFFIHLPENYPSPTVLPDFTKITTYESLEFIFVIAFIGSLDTLINVKSIDAVDFYRRKSKTNRELIALGIGNVICGVLGALPMISSMIFSSTNVNSGAKTRWSNLFLGLMFLVFILFASAWIELIPMASLSAILIITAYRLFSRKLVRDIYEVGIDQLCVFLVTLLTSLIFGLIIAVIIGLITSFIIYIILGAEPKSLFTTTVKVVNYSNQRSKIMVRSSALASNYLNLSKQIAKLPKGNQIYLDFAKSKVVDHSFLELVYHHPYNFNNEEGSIELQGLEDHFSVSKHPLATRRIKQKSHTKLEDLTLFNDRQLDVLAVASINNSKIRPNLTYDGNKLQGFNFALGYDIKYRENKFSINFDYPGFAKPAKMEFSDIFLSKGIRMSEQSHNLSVLLITQLPMYIPAFTLGRENLLSKMWQRVGYDDIDFEDYPVFSEHYLLKGVNESEIRRFFTNNLLEFLEENQDFNIESSDNNILIHKDMHLMSRIEIEDCIEFVENFLRIIYQKEDHQQTAIIN